MTDVVTREALALRWKEMLSDRSLHDLPYRIELNPAGKVEMSPASNRHSRLQGALATQLGRGLIGGAVFTACSVLTRIGIRCPDVAWASPEFMSAYGEITPYLRAPEICVQIVSGADAQADVDEKTAAYLAAGADEVWLVTEDGRLRYIGAAGEKTRSDFPIAISLPPPAASPP